MSTSPSADVPQLVSALQGLDRLLASPDAEAKVGCVDLTLLRQRLVAALQAISAGERMLSDLDGTAVIKTDPSYISQRYQIIMSIETARSAVTYDVLPILERVTLDLVVRVRDADAPKCEARKPSGPILASPNNQDVLTKTERLLEQGDRAVSIGQKIHNWYKALESLWPSVPPTS